MEIYICGFEVLGKLYELYGDILVLIIYKKLFLELKKSFVRDYSNKEWILDEFCKVIFKEVEVFEVG